MSALTQKTSGRALMLAVAALLIASIAFFGPPGHAEGPVEVNADAGVILLSTEPGNEWVRYYESPTAPLDVDAYDAHQSLAVSTKCEVTSDGSILTLTQDPTGRGLGLVSNGFGTRAKNNCATSNGQIAVGESVTVALGSMFGASFGIDHMEADVEGKQNADLLLMAGGDEIIIINPASDNGPDSGIGDNIIVERDFTDPVTSLGFGATGNSKALISLEGGGDGLLAGGTERGTLGVNQTLFSVVSSRTFDGELNCVESRTVGDLNPDESGPAVVASVTRGLNDSAKSDTCTRVPYTLLIDTTNVFFDFYDSLDQGARFMVKIVWDPGVDPISPPIREIDYEDDGTRVPGVACLPDAGETYASPPSADDNYVHPTSATYPDGVPACLAHHELVLTPDGWQQIQWWHVIGDPKWY